MPCQGPSRRPDREGSLDRISEFALVVVSPPDPSMAVSFDAETQAPTRPSTDCSAYADALKLFMIYILFN